MIYSVFQKSFYVAHTLPSLVKETIENVLRFEKMTYSALHPKDRPNNIIIIKPKASYCLLLCPAHIIPMYIAHTPISDYVNYSILFYLV